MKNILVFGMTENPGGVESVIMNYYKNINPQKIRFDFLCNTKEKIAYEDYIQKHGSKIYKITARNDNPIKYKKEVRQFFKKYSKKYDCFWMNVNNLVNIDYLILAKKYGIERRIIHSHNSKIMDDGVKGKIKGLIHNVNKKVVVKYATDFWACSSEAADFFYKTKKKPNIKIIENAIDVNKFEFDDTRREKIRKQYNILANDIVIGDIGRLESQKNIGYLISVFERYHKINPNSYLMIVGNGSLQKELKKIVMEKRLTKNVIFTGAVANTQDYLSAFDVFMMPSLYEGLPVTLVEAQAAGLKCVVADNITKEVNVSENIEYLPIDSTAIDLWKSKVTKSQNRIDEGKKLLGSVFDISRSADYLEKKILEVIK